MVGSPTARSVGVALYVAQSGRGAGIGSGSTSSIVAGANGKKMMDIKEENLDVKRSMEVPYDWVWHRLVMGVCRPLQGSLAPH